MNIIKVISSLSYGGAETQVIALAKELANQGHQLTIITTTNYVPRADQLKNTGVELICFDKRSKLDLKLVWELRRQFSRIRPDIVHAYLFDAELFSRLAGIGLGIPILNSERNDQYELNLNQKIANILTIRLVDGVIANSYAGCQHASGIYHHLKKQSLQVVWNGAELSKIHDALKACEKNYREEWFGDASVKIAVMVAAIKPVKDYRLALKVAEALIQCDPSWRVVFLGDQLVDKGSEYKKEVVRQYEEMKEGEKIRFVGNREDVVEILDQADVSFLTSHHEGFPNTVLESMAVGTPVITTDFSDIKLIAIEEWLVLKNRDPLKFAQVLIRAEKCKEQLSTKSIEWVKKNCSIQESTKNLLNVYTLFSEQKRQS